MARAKHCTVRYNRQLLLTYATPSGWFDAHGAMRNSSEWTNDVERICVSTTTFLFSGSPGATCVPESRYFVT